MSRGFLGNDASFMLDAVVCALALLLPALAWSIWLVKTRRAWALHRNVQIALGVVLVLAVAAFEIDLQVIHEDDVGRALLQCVVAAGPPGAYNIAADEVLSMVDFGRDIGLLTVPLPGGPARAAARLVAKVPRLPQAAQWVEAAAHPAIMDTSKAQEELGWSPKVPALAAVRSSLP